MATERIVALAVDGSVHSDNVLNYYLDRVQMPDDKLLLIHVPEEYNFTDASPAVIHELINRMTENANEIQQKYTEKMKKSNVDVTFKIGYGDPGEQIVKIAESNNASLLMVGSRGHGWLRRTILGSVSNYVIHHTCIPVLVCKHPEQVAEG